MSPDDYIEKCDAGDVHPYLLTGPKRRFLSGGTTGQVAQALGRHIINLDLDRRNDALKADRMRQPSLLMGEAA